MTIDNLRAAFRAGVVEGRRHASNFAEYGEVHQGTESNGTQCGLPTDPTSAPGSPYVTCPDCLFAQRTYRVAKGLEA